MRPSPCFMRSPPVLLTLVAALYAPAGAAAPPLTPPPGTPVLPTGLTVNKGSALSSSNGRQLNISTSPNAVLQWQDFSIGAGYGVNFQQLNAQSQVLNRVSGQNPSYILGNLTSNGKVWLLNPNGVLFGQNARVDVGGLIASTLTLDDADFESGRYQLIRDSSLATNGRGIVNQGSITTAYGGQILLVSANIDNSGSLDAPGGHASLLAGDSVELIDTGLPFLGFKLPLASGSAINSGRIQAEQIDIYGGVVNQQGLVKAESLSLNAQGQIVLSAVDRLDISGRVDASHADGKGGKILLRGDTIRVQNGAIVDASGSSGGGVISTARPGDEQALSSQTLIESGARLQADATLKGNGGEIWLWSQSGTQVFGPLSARGGAQGGNGGFIETSSHRGLQVQRAPDISAVHGLGGTWLIDPDQITIQDSNPGLDPEVLLAQTIEVVLNAGGNFIVEATDAIVGDPYGSIYVNAAINKTAGGEATLTLRATHQIDINQPITGSPDAGKLNLVVHSNSDAIGFTTTAVNADLSLNGGALGILGGPLALANDASIRQALIGTSAPRITLAPNTNSTFDGVILAAGSTTTLNATSTLTIQNGLHLGGILNGGTLNLGSGTLTLLDQSRINQTRIIGTGQAQVVLGSGLVSTFNGVTLDGGIASTTLGSDSMLTILDGLTLNSLLQLTATKTVPASGRGATVLFVGDGLQLLTGNGLVKTRDFDFAETASNDAAYIRVETADQQGLLPATLQIGTGITLQHEANALSIDNLAFNAGQIIVNGAGNGITRLEINKNSLETSLSNSQLIRANSATQVEIFGNMSNAADAVIQSEGGQIKLDRLTGNAGTIQTGASGFGGAIDINDLLSTINWINSGTLRTTRGATLNAYGNHWINSGLALAEGANNNTETSGSIALIGLSENSGTLRATANLQPGLPSGLLTVESNTNGDSWTNTGLVEANGGQVRLNHLSSNTNLIRAGLAGSGGSVAINDITGGVAWTNSGTLRASGAASRIDLYGDWNNAGAGLLDAAGGVIAFRSLFASNDIGIANSSAGGGYEIGPGGEWNNSGQIYILNPAGHLGSVSFTGSDSDNPLAQAKLSGGTIGASQGSELRVASFASGIFDGVTLGNGVTTTVDANGLLLIDNGLILAGAVLRLITENNDATQGTALIFRSLDDSDHPQPHLSGTGSVFAMRSGNIGGGSALISGEDGNLIIDSGITVEAQSDLLLVQGLLLNQARLRTAGGNLAVEGFDWTNAGLIEAGTGDIQLGGLINNSGTIHSIGGDIHLQPSVTLFNDSDFGILSTGFVNSGIINLEAHTSFEASDGFTNAETGTITGSGTIDVGENALINQGRIDPGYLSQIGTLSILGNFTQESSGSLRIDARSRSNVDVLDISGAARFGGRLRLVLADSYEPDPDDVLTAARYDSRTGGFDSFSAPGAPGNPRLRYRPQQLEVFALKNAPSPPEEPSPTQPPPTEPPPTELPPTEPPPTEPPPSEPPPTEPPPTEPPPAEPPPTEPPPTTEPPPVVDQGPAAQIVTTNLDKLPTHSLPPFKPSGGLSTTTVVDASHGGDFDMLIKGIGQGGTGTDDPGRYLLTDGNITVFRNVPIGQLEKGDIKLLLDAREAYKDDIFAYAIAALEKNPELADLPFCTSLQQADTGHCILTSDLQKLALAKKRANKQATALIEATIPSISRKRALVIGLNQYRDSRIPQLTSALPDARLIGQELSSRLGYEVTTLANPGKREITRWLNRVALEMSETDSLVIYFAGHGEMVDKTGLGYWIPSDATARDPSGWISNADVSHWLGLMQSKQVALIIDSCYSGTFASPEGLAADTSASNQTAENYLNKRSVAVMTSGSDEPVADTGNNGHSLFAWNLIQQLQSLDSWTPGSNLFLSVRDQVERELPQSPQYGAALKAGHQPGGDFLFERRKILQ